MNRGEIWWAELDSPRGSEPGYKRPVVIIQANDYNISKINTVICVIITSNIKLRRAPGNVYLPTSESTLKNNSVINTSQIITIDKDFLVDYVSRLNRSTVRKLNKGLQLILELE